MTASGGGEAAGDAAAACTVVGLTPGGCVAECPQPASSTAPSEATTRIDRLARSTFDLFAIVRQIVDAEGQFRSLAEHAVKFAPVGPRAGHLLAVDVAARASGLAKLLKLAVEGLPVSGYASIADEPFFGVSFDRNL